MNAELGEMAYADVRNTNLVLPDQNTRQSRHAKHTSAPSTTCIAWFSTQKPGHGGG